MKLSLNILMSLLACSIPVWSHGEMKSGYPYLSGSKRNTGKAAERRAAKRRAAKRRRKAK